MKVLEICMSKGFGGLELYVLKVAQYLNNVDHISQVLTIKNSFLSTKLSDNNIESDNFSSVFHHLPLISAIKLAKYINVNEIDV